MSSVLDKFGRRLDAAMVKYDDADPKLFEATYNPKSGLYRNKAGTVAFRNKADAEEYNKAIGILPPADNSNVVVANNEIKTENQVRKEFNKNNFVSRNANGKSTWELMKETADPGELKELNAIEQKHSNKPTYPKEATPQQMATLKKKIDKYKYIHGEQKPFKQPIKVSEKSKEYAERMTKVLFDAAADVARKEAEEIRQKKNQIPDAGSNIPEARTTVPLARNNVPIEEQPQYRNTIFGSDVYYRRKRGL